jgi:hypothetical protein
VAGRKVEDVDQRRILVNRVVEVSDLAAAAGVGGADELPEPVVGVVRHQQDTIGTADRFSLAEPTTSSQAGDRQCTGNSRADRPVARP